MGNLKNIESLIDIDMNKWLDEVRVEIDNHTYEKYFSLNKEFHIGLFNSNNSPIGKNSLIYDYASVYNTDLNDLYDFQNLITPDLQIAFILSLLVDKIDNQSISDDFNINIVVQDNFFLNIAKIRALRKLVQAILNLNSLELDFSITAHNSNLNKSLLDEENNLIRATLEGISAYLGSANKYIPLPFRLNSDNFSSRISENINLLLEHEAYFFRVSDPLAGSYSVETITEKLLDMAWNKFIDYYEVSQDQLIDIMKIESNKILKQKKNRLEKGEISLIGVNKFLPKSINYKPNIDNRLASELEKITNDLIENPFKIYIVNFQKFNNSNIIQFLKEFRLEHEVSSIFELIEDAVNAVKIYNPNIIILNTDDDSIKRIIDFELSNYIVLKISEFNNNSILDIYNNLKNKK